MNGSRHVPLLALALVCCTGVPPRPPPPLGNQTASASAAAQPRTPAQAFAAAAPEFGFPDPDRRKKLESAFPEIDRIGEAELQRQRYPGLVVGVVIDGDLAYSNGFGMTDLDKKQKPNADTIYRIGSITKSFTGLAVLALRDDGALSLDDPLSRFVPEAAGIVYPVRDAPPITLRHLLTHRSGLPNPGPFLDIAAKGHVRTEDEITKALSGFALETVPGTWCL